jgi:ADP-ribosylglycohydrolase
MKFSDLLSHEAVLYGVACGDTLGYQVEFSRLGEIRKRFGPDGPKDFPKGAQWSDDTQMMLAVAEGLIAFSEGGDRASMLPEVVMPYIAREFVKWSVSPENTRAPGTTCMAGCRALRAGEPWTRSGVDSKGCGSAMRVAPVGLFCSNRIDLARTARASSMITHTHAAAVEAAHVAALFVRLILDGTTDVDALLAQAYPTLSDARFWSLLGAVPTAIKAVLDGAARPEAIMTAGGPGTLGESWTGDEAVASALFCYGVAAACGEGFVTTVRLGANTAGDSDSIAAIAGSLAGARWGIGGKLGIPKKWIERLEDPGRIKKTARRLFDSAALRRK